MTPERLAQIREKDRLDHERGTVAPSQVPDIVAHRTELLAALDEARAIASALAKSCIVGGENHDDLLTYLRLWGAPDVTQLPDWLAAAAQHTYDVEVFHLEENVYFGTGWTWCPLIDGNTHDYSPELPHCADEADARAKAAAWLASRRPITATTKNEA